MKKSTARLNELESMFVKEFRACQALFHLSRDERLALSHDDIERLLHLTAQKESMLDELAALESAKFDSLRELGVTSDSAQGKSQTMKLVGFLSDIDRELASRLLHIQEGTLILINQIRAITLVNRAMAVSALARASSIQAQLLNTQRLRFDDRRRLVVGDGDEPFHASEESFEITSFSKEQTALPAVFAAIITARDALSRDDPSAISSAVSDLKNALEGITGCLDFAEAGYMDEGTLLADILSDETTVTDNTISLVEIIAGLYHQGNAYQASLNASDRMLALV